ncbi:phage tail sheath subtilisin-like domain-containing protein (plasmid) [Phormidium sp. CLA17]|uniref:phage tail sheath subtilisin-like domain-containing protein n=1 Tax=Leptolyngbya sp. Cla-17 TaxID=2803751 RepID=UPI0014910870|nr:phage tail sheath subtilisin-like domain-containing protein [Leptolyngbya sp. Cla-17]MBM0745389.1 phage tail sheath subtilisin-like domain-containing protein [Leptolyngbya sp. Cla-17]
MANLTYPGVYVEEVSSGIRPIQSAGTSTAAFIGIAEKGPLNEAVKIFNFTEYQNLYGSFLNNSFLSHSVYQFFNNGGSQCYIIRIGTNLKTANIVLKDRGSTAQPSLTISAKSPGVWGNQLAVQVTDGSNDPANEFNLLVYRQDAVIPSDLTKATLLERIENLSMVPGSANFFATRTSASKQIQATVTQIQTTVTGNPNVQAGSSLGAGTPLPLTIAERKKFRINIDGDGYQEVDLQTAVGLGAGQVTDLNSTATIASAIAFAVRRLTKLRASTNQAAFDNFTCAPNSEGVLLLTSGASSLASSVTVAPAINSSEDASGLLKLGKLNSGKETIGGAVTRPLVNPIGIPYYFLGDNTENTAQVVSIQVGSDGDLVNSDQPFIAALPLLDTIDDVSLIAIPGIGSEAIVGAGMKYCANRSLSDCFFIGDMRQDNDTVAEAEIFAAAVSPKNSYGAVYIPWVKMLDPTGVLPEPILVPPSGFVAGLYAKTDAQRGVWKAPAGVNVGLGGAVGLAVNFTDVQQGNLNDKNINGIRQFASSGIVLWGARTMSADPEWKYIPVRRMAIFLRVSIYRGIQFAVFEPNDEPLWSQLRLNIGSFMTGLFRRGAFQGATPSQAFFVKCDGETTTQDDINVGRVNVLVGFAPLKPAEFVVVKISQKAGQSS